MLFSLLPPTACAPFPVVVLLMPQPQHAACPLSTVHQMFPCLLEALLATTVLPKWRAYLCYDFPIAVTIFLAAHSPPVLCLFQLSQSFL